MTSDNVRQGRPPAPETPREQGHVEVFVTVLRRWWGLALPLGLVLGGLAAAGAYLLFPPLYQAKALVRISEVRPYIAFPEDNWRNTSEMTRYVRSQVELIRSSLVLGQVVTNPEIARLPEITELEEPITDLAPLIEMSAVNESELLSISFKGRNPANAAAIVNAITDAYFALRDRQEAERSARVIELLENESNSRAVELSRLRDNVRELAKQTTGKDPFVAPTSAEKNALHPLAELQNRLTLATVEQSTLRAQITAYEEMMDKGPTEARATDVERAVEGHPEVQRLKAQIAADQARLRQTETASARGNQDPTFLRRQRELQQTEQALEKVRQDLQPQVKTEIEAALATKHKTSLAEMKLRLEGLTLMEQELGKRYAEQLDGMKQASGDTLELDFKRDELKRAQDVYDRILSRIVALRTERGAPARVELLIAARAPQKPLQKLPYKPMGMGLFLGLCSPFALLFLREFRLRRVSDADQLQRQAHLTVIGEIAHLPSRGKLGAATKGRVRRDLRLFRESIDGLRTYLALSAESREMHVLVVTSAVSREGKTSVAAQLAVSLARATGERTLLIDADLRDPDLHTIFQTELDPGFAQVLGHQASLDEAVVASRCTNLDVLPAGKLHASPHKLLGNGALGSLLEAARATYRYVVIDTPPILSASESLVLAKSADAALLCVMRDYSRMAQVRAAFDRLVDAGARPVGAVFNNVPTSRYAYTYGDYGHPVE